jgi:hypothetical protein
VVVVPEAVVLAALTGGTEIGWPAAEHWETTATETEDWSARLQALCTQGVIFGTSSGFWQWQAKSVKDEHPSAERAETKQSREQLGTSGSCALTRPAARRTKEAREKCILDMKYSNQSRGQDWT